MGGRVRSRRVDGEGRVRGGELGRVRGGEGMVEGV